MGRNTVSNVIIPWQLKGHYAVAKLTTRQNMFVIVLMTLVTRIYFIYQSLLGAYHCITIYLYVIRLHEALKRG